MRNILLLVILCFPLMGEAVSVQLTKLTGQSEVNQVEVNGSKELITTDTPNLGGTSVVFNLTTTPVQLKVGALAKVNRKYVLMEALGSNVQWGFTIACIFSLKKNSFYMLPVGEDTIVYIKASTGVTTMAGGEI